MTVSRRFTAVVALALVAGTATAERISIEGSDGPTLQMHWLLAADAPGARPAIVALHGCGGLYRRDGQGFERRCREYVERLHRTAYHVLLPDSFGSRGATSICAQAGSDRTITVEMRRADVLDAVHWLAGRSEVDPRRIALVGWSHGAMTALAAANAAQAPAAPVAGVVAFYPGCNALLRLPFATEMPLLLLLGERDDWTPPERCLQLHERVRKAQPDADITLKMHADSVHGFDSTRPVRLRTDVRHGVDPRGVHTGGNPAARVQSQQEMDAFLARVLQ